MSERKLYALSPSQRSIFLAWKYSFKKQVMNITTSVLIDADLDLNVLKRAAEKAIQRNDSFAIRITKHEKDRMQYFAEPAVINLDIVDFSGKTEEAMEKFFIKVGRKIIPLDDRPLARLYIVKAPDGRCGLFSSVSHLILDSWAISMFYKDVLTLYYLVRDNQPLPKPLPRYEVLLQKELEYPRSAQHDADGAFWLQEVAGQPTLPIYTHVNGSIVLEELRKKKKDPTYRYGNSFYLRTNAAHEVIMVDKPDIDLMKAYCTKYRISAMQLLFIFGMRTYLSRVNGREQDVSMTNTVARRGTLEEKFAGGTRVHFLSFRTNLPETMTFREALDFLSEKQMNLYRHMEFSPLEMFGLEYKNLPNYKPGSNYRAATMTFQPVPMEGPHGERVSTKWYCNGAAGQPFYLTIMDGDGTGALRCYYEYLTHVIKPETVRKCHGFMMQVLKAGMINPDITIKELLDLPV